MNSIQDIIHYIKWHNISIETLYIVFWASTVRILLDYVTHRAVTIATVVLQYFSASLVWYLAYISIDVDNALKSIYISCAVLLSRDIISFIVSKEWLQFAKDFILTLLKK